MEILIAFLLKMVDNTLGTFKTISLNKENKILNITSEGNFNFGINHMEVTFMEGCSEFSRDYWVMIDKGKLENKRSIDEVRQILNNHPEFLDRNSVYHSLVLESYRNYKL